MQQTETYKLNLIEKTDTFSPDALNENTQKVEAALTQKADAADTNSLEGRVTALEAKRVALGTYQGTNRPLTIELGFTPASVLLFCMSGSALIARLMIKGEEYMRPNTEVVEAKIVNDGFYVNSGVYNSSTPHYFVAIA